MAESNIAVIGAVVANVAIATLKFVGAAVTGSSAMLSEGIHSVVDAGNGGLLLVGQRLSARPPDERHPFGFGKDLYFWSLIVAVLIFGVGGGVSVYEGIVRLITPHDVENASWNFAILGAAFVFEGTSLVIAVRQFRREAGSGPFWATVRASKDPTLYTVIAEDSAALAGLVAAAVGLGGSVAFGWHWLDAAASIVIGLLLCGVSSLLVVQSRRLLVGEAVDAGMARDIRRMAQGEPTVHHAAWPLTMHLGPDDVLLAIDAEFRDGTSAHEIAQAVNRIEAAIRGRYPEIGRIYIEQRRVARADAGPPPAEA